MPRPLQVEIYLWGEEEEVGRPLNLFSSCTSLPTPAFFSQLSLSSDHTLDQSSGFADKEIEGQRETETCLRSHNHLVTRPEREILPSTALLTSGSFLSSLLVSSPYLCYSSYHPYCPQSRRNWTLGTLQPRATGHSRRTREGSKRMEVNTASFQSLKIEARPTADLGRITLTLLMMAGLLDPGTASTDPHQPVKITWRLQNGLT